MSPYSPIIPRNLYTNFNPFIENFQPQTENVQALTPKSIPDTQESPEEVPETQPAVQN